MLSFLFRLIRAFSREHGYSPNFVVMNAQHYQRLRAEIPEMRDHASVSRFLRLEIILSEESVHPHVRWMPSAQDRSSAG